MLKKTLVQIIGLLIFVIIALLVAFLVFLANNKDKLMNYDGLNDQLEGCKGELANTSDQLSQVTKIKDMLVTVVTKNESISDVNLCPEVEIS